MGLRGPEHIYLMEEHFAQTLNETEHLEYMESRGGGLFGGSLCRQTPYLSTIGSTWFCWLSPRAAYHLSYEIELHAEDTYAKYLKYEDCDDKDIERIVLDERHHAQELKEKVEMIK